jgi:hypothetical protein
MDFEEWLWEGCWEHHTDTFSSLHIAHCWHDFHVVGSGIDIHAFSLYFCCHVCCSCIIMPAFIVPWASGSGWVSPGNVVHTFHDYERQHLLNHSTVCGPPRPPECNLSYTDYRLPNGPIKVGRPRGVNLGSMGINRRNTVIMR